MKLTQRDKKLLICLGIVAILLIPYFFIFKAFEDKTDSLVTQEDQLQSQYNHLVELKNNVPFYETELARFEQEKNDVLSRYPADLEQESSIMFFNDIERLMDIRLHQYAFNTTEEKVIEKQSDPAVESTGQETQSDSSTTETANQVVTKSITDELTLVMTTTQFSYLTNYDTFKQFLNYLKTNGIRVSLTFLNVSYDSELLNGSFAIAQYALKGKDREVNKTAVPNVNLGVANIFDANAKASNSQLDGLGGTQVVGQSYDAFVIINPPGADINPVVVGLANDISGESFLQSKENSTHDVKITFTEEGNKYYISYLLGTKEYKSEAVDLGDHIDLRVLSSKHSTDNDKVSVNLSVVNKTSQKVYVNIINDDSEKSRIKMSTTTGEVVVK